MMLSKRLNPLAESLTIGLRTQSIWGIPHAIWFLAMGIGGGLYLWRQLLGLNLGMWLGWPLADILSLLLIGVGGIILIADLGRPVRFLRAVINAPQSWISIGAISDFAFLLFAVLLLAPDLAVAGHDPFAWLPWRETTMMGRSLAVVAGVAAFVVMVYAGFVLSSSSAIPFWHSSMVPLQFLASSLVGALAVAMVMAPLSPAIVQEVARLTWPVVFLLVISLMLMTLHLVSMSSSPPAAIEAVRLITRGPLAGHFLAGVVVVGHLVPLSLILLGQRFEWFWLGAEVSAGILILLGGFFLRYTILKAGVFAPLL